MRARRIRSRATEAGSRGEIVSTRVRMISRSRMAYSRFFSGRRVRETRALAPKRPWLRFIRPAFSRRHRSDPTLRLAGRGRVIRAHQSPSPAPAVRRPSSRSQSGNPSTGSTNR
jgi:hypothetical protein